METTLTTRRPTSAAAVPAPAEVARPAAGPVTAAGRPRRAAGSVLAGAVAVLLTVLTPGVAFAWDADSFSSADEQELVTLTNQSRAAAGLPALKVDPALTSMARWRSKDMMDRDYFSHAIPPDGKKVFDYLKADGYCYKVAGENIGVNNFPDDIATETIHQGFMDSSSHRANILGTTWTHIGVGAYKGAAGKHIWTVLFTQKCSSSPSPTPTPNPTPTPAPTATPNPTPTATPTPTPKPKPTATPQPGSTPTPTPAPTATPEATPTPTPEPSPIATPSPTPDLDPAELAGRLGGVLRFGRYDVGGGHPSIPGPGGEPGEPGFVGGLQVVDPADPSGLVEAIVGDVAGGFFGG